MSVWVAFGKSCCFGVFAVSVACSRAHIAQTIEFLHGSAGQKLVEVLHEAAQRVHFDDESVVV